MTKIVFHIYFAGINTQTKQFIQLYEGACNKHLKAGSFEINLIDIIKRPESAEKHKILATPTISRVSPAPEKRIIGKLNEEQANNAVRFLTEDLSID